MDGAFITTVQAKSHLRVDFSDDDTYIDSLIALVEELVLTEIQGSIAGEGTVSTVATTALVGVSTNFMDFEVGHRIKVYDETIRTIATITDNENLTVTLAFTNTDSGLTYTMYQDLPNVSATIPRGLYHAMLLMIGHFYQIREPVMIGVSVTKIPYAFEFLIAPYKNWTVS